MDDGRQPPRIYLPFQAVSHIGSMYSSNQIRHAKPVAQLTHTIRSPPYMNTTHTTKIP